MSMVLVDRNGRPMLPTSPYGRTSRGLQDWADFMRTIRNPDGLGVDTYERMVDTDETVNAGIEFISLSVIGCIGEYHHPKKKIQKFVRRDIEGMRHLLGVVVEDILTGLWAGSSVTELHLTELRGQVRTVDLPTIAPSTVAYKLAKEGLNAGCVDMIEQRTTLGRTVSIEAENFIHWSHRGRFGNPYGTSRLRACWKYWFPKDVLLASWCRGLEQYSTPKAIARTTAPEEIIKTDMGSMSRAEYLLMQMGEFADSSRMVWDPNTQIEFLEITRNFGEDFERFQMWSNQMILRACLIPALLFTGGDGKGSYALAGKAHEVSQRGIWRIRDSVAHALIHQWIARLIILNYGEQQDGYGEFRGQQLEEEDIKLWSEIFFSLIQAGLIRPELPQDFEWMREKIGAPKGVPPAAPPELEPAPGGGAGEDGLPDVAPDGRDDITPGVPRPAPKTPKKKQGRPGSE